LERGRKTEKKKKKPKERGQHRTNRTTIGREGRSGNKKETGRAKRLIPMTRSTNIRAINEEIRAREKQRKKVRKRTSGLPASVVREKWGD